VTQVTELKLYTDEKGGE